MVIGQKVARNGVDLRLTLKCCSDGAEGFLRNQGVLCGFGLMSSWKQLRVESLKHNLCFFGSIDY